MKKRAALTFTCLQTSEEMMEFEASLWFSAFEPLWLTHCVNGAQMIYSK